MSFSRRSAHPLGWVAVPAALLVLAAATLLPAASAHAAAPAPRWQLSSTSEPTVFAPQDTSGHDSYLIYLTNVGDAPQNGEPIVITDTLPPGLTATGFEFLSSQGTTDGVPRDLRNNCTLAPLLQCIYYPGPETSSGKILPPGATEPPLRPEWPLEMRVFVSSTAKKGPLDNTVTATGGGAPDATATSTNPVSRTPAPFGLQSFELQARNADGSTYTQAGGHPYELTAAINFNTVTADEGAAGFTLAPSREPHDVIAETPPGLLGDPQAVPRCTLAEFATVACPADSQVGTWGAVTGSGPYPQTGVIYNVAPQPGRTAALGLIPYAKALNLLLEATLRSGGDYGLRVASPATLRTQITSLQLTFWGNPADPGHAPYGAACLGGEAVWRGSCPSGAPAAPFLTMPTSCSGASLPAALSADSWEEPGLFASAATTMDALDGCNQLAFAPEIEARPTTDLADSPSGLDVDLHIPQDFHDPEALATADLRDATVSLPAGITVNPASANGLAACSEEQVGYKPGTSAPFEFTPGPAACPDASKLGTVAVDTPLLPNPLPGAVYLARQGENPFGSLLALYVVVDDPISGVIVKLAGRVTPDPSTGRLTTTFSENPQLPFEDFHLNFFGGAQGALRTPPTCGTYTTTSVLTPWSAPESGPPAEKSDEFQITAPAGGSGVCPGSAGAQENAPRFHAGTEASQAGAFSPFSLRLVREDGSQELAKVETTLPPGLTGRLAGVGECSPGDLVAAENKSGAAEQGGPSCPASSEVGTVQVGAGTGPTPYYVTGQAYLAGPYKGAPISLAIITPAVAGPFDLGDVVVRTALYVDPETAQIKAVSDPIPHILDGIPLDVRSVTLKMSRPNFTLNPTNCSEFHFSGSATSVLGQSAPLSQRFQVGNCAALPFKPKLSIALKGSTKHAGHPGLKAVLTYPKGGPYANVAAAQVNLPHSEFIDQANLNKTCTKPVLLAGNCPATSIYGKATAWTPLLEKPLEGPVYLVGGYGYKLPALVAELNGQIRVLLVGKVDSGPNKGIRNTFEAVPDAPVEKFVLEMKGGPKYSLLENSENLCAKPQKAIASFTAQNGKVLALHPTVANDCGKKHERQGGPKKHGGGHGKAGHHGGRPGSSRSRALTALLRRGW